MHKQEETLENKSRDVVLSKEDILSKIKELESYSDKIEHLYDVIEIGSRETKRFAWEIIEEMYDAAKTKASERRELEKLGAIAKETGPKARRAF